MSLKKVIRLKTPVKSREEGKSSEPTQLSGVEFNQQSTIMLVKNVACSQELQITLINEINKLYKEISKLQHSLEEATSRYEQALKENKIIKNQIEILERESQGYREMYDLEKENHNLLRRFYEMREKQWLTIVSQHKKILQEYNNRSFNGISQIKMQPEYIKLQHMYTTIQQVLTKCFTPLPKQNKPADRKEKRKLRNSLEREDSLSGPKLKNKLNSQKQINVYKDISQIRQDTSKSPLKSFNERSQKMISSMCKPLQSEQLFDTVLKKTYFKYREKQIYVCEFEKLEDMIKLKNAKTSTKQRLVKTIKKLDFQVSNQQQLRFFCESVQKLVIEKYKTLRGDYAFEIIIDRLKQCQRLALGCSTIFERSGKDRTLVNNSLLDKKKIKSINKLEFKIKESEIYNNKTQKDIQLLIDSTIKDDKTLEKIRKLSPEDDFGQKIKQNQIQIRRNE